MRWLFTACRSVIWIYCLWFLFTSAHYSPIFLIHPLSSLPAFSIISPYCQFINYITKTHPWWAQFVPNARMLTALFIVKLCMEFSAMEFLEQNTNAGNLLPPTQTYWQDTLGKSGYHSGLHFKATESIAILSMLILVLTLASIITLTWKNPTHTVCRYLPSTLSLCCEEIPFYYVHT